MDAQQQPLSLSCPSCGMSRIFTTRQGYKYAITQKSVCNTCSGKQKIFSEFHRNKLSMSKIGNKNPMFDKIGFCGKGSDNPMFGKIGVNHPAFGRKHSAESKQKIRIAVAKYAKTPEYRNKMSLLLVGKNKGKFRSDETKLKMRGSRLRRLEELGISQKEDRGANIFFHTINKYGYDFKPKRFINIGYDADGYDEKRHIWCEFDTPYHNVLSQQRKDLVRQTTIIQHFEAASRPLNAFIRVKSDSDGNVKETKCIYNAGRYTDIILEFPLNSIYL